MIGLFALIVTLSHRPASSRNRAVEMRWKAGCYRKEKKNFSVLRPDLNPSECDDDAAGSHGGLHLGVMNLLCNLQSSTLLQWELRHKYLLASSVRLSIENLFTVMRFAFPQVLFTVVIGSFMELRALSEAVFSSLCLRGAIWASGFYPC